MRMSGLGAGWGELILPYRCFLVCGVVEALQCFSREALGDVQSTS
jgi:hypothetical protein